MQKDYFQGHFGRRIHGKTEIVYMCVCNHHDHIVVQSLIIIRQYSKSRSAVDMQFFFWNTFKLLVYIIYITCKGEFLSIARQLGDRATKQFKEYTASTACHTEASGLEIMGKLLFTSIHI